MTEKLGGDEAHRKWPLVDSQARHFLPMAPGHISAAMLLPSRCRKPHEQNGGTTAQAIISIRRLHLMGFGAFTILELLFVIVFIHLRYQSEGVWLPADLHRWLMAQLHELVGTAFSTCPVVGVNLLKR